MAKLAIGSWAYIFGPYAAHPVSLEETVRRVGALGFDGLELSGFAPHADPDRYPTRRSRSDLMALLDDHGLAVPGYAPDFSATPPAVVPRSVYVERFQRSLQFCVDCGIRKLRVDSVSEPGTAEVGQEAAVMERVAAVWHHCAQLAQDAGVLVVWEFEPGFMFNKPSQVLGLCRQVDHPNFRVLFDSCHAHLCATQAARHTPPAERLAGGAIELAGQLHGRIGHVHLIDSDNTLHDGTTSTHAPFGLGVLDFPPLVQALQAAGYRDPWWCVDLCFWPQAWEASAAAREYMAALLAAVP